MYGVRMKIEEIQKLNDEILSLTIANILGWKQGICQCGTPFCRRNPTVRYIDPAGTWHDEYPSYATDLNEIHEAEMSLSEVDINKLDTVLWNICHNATGKLGAIHANARQRAEVFVLTMQKE